MIRHDHGERIQHEKGCNCEKEPDIISQYIWLSDTSKLNIIIIRDRFSVNQTRNYRLYIIYSMDDIN